jgi:putative PIN family toxin of toxin-antitoxin system
MISACLDANIYISGIAFGGKPLQVLERALNREFFVVTGPNILDEVERNLIGKLGLDKKRVQTFMTDIFDISSVYVPTGKMKPIQHHADSLVLELAVMGSADVLVTGDKRHLLPLKEFQGIIIEPPSKFLLRLDNMK